MKLGKRPATHDPRDLLLGRYVLERQIPLLPTVDLGHPDRFPSQWGVLGNDRYGDCVFAGADHETMLWLSEAGAGVGFTEQDALSDYAAVTGFDPADPWTDQGTNMRDAMSYRRNTGIVDTAGNRHKIGAYVALQPGNITQLKQCIWLFGTVAIGFEFPGTAMDQFDRGQAWTVVNGAEIEGGHYVPGVLYHAREDMFEVITWGQRQRVAPSFLQKYMDEAYGMISEEMLITGRSLEGFDLATLNADLMDIGNRTPPTPAPAPTPAPTPTPTPAPAPAPAPADEDHVLWNAVKGWVPKRHAPSTKPIAGALKTWAKAKNIT